MIPGLNKYRIKIPDNHLDQLHFLQPTIRQHLFPEKGRNPFNGYLSWPHHDKFVKKKSAIPGSHPRK